MRYGSLFNTVMDRSKSPEVEVGMGATVLMWSDRQAATVVGFTTFKSGKRKGQVKTVTVQRDKATRTDSNGMGDAQSYEYERDEQGALRTFLASSKGGWKQVGADGKVVEGGGAGLLLGVRKEYYDFSF